MASEETSVACLLMHGLNGSPYDMVDLAASFEAHGIATDNVLLPGHEMHHRQAALYGWDEWVQTARERFEALVRRYDRVAIVGHSMGGALALHLAASDPRVTGIATLCAPIQMHPGLEPMVTIGHRLIPFFPMMREDIRDPAERRAYRQLKRTRFGAMAPVYSLLKALPALRAELIKVCCPVLIIAARNDHVVPARDARYLFEAIGSRDKQLIMLERSWHVVMRDVERDIVADHVVEFVERIASIDQSERGISRRLRVISPP